MKSMIGGSLAALCGIAMAAAPQAANAGVVGEYNACGSENLSVAVVAAGHTWVSVAALDQASLQGLDALILRQCGGYSANAAVDSAVAEGMDLVLDVGSVADASLPGTPVLGISSIGNCETNYSLVPGAAITTGPGGTLTDDSLDVGSPGGSGGYCSFMGSAPVASLPAGTLPFFTTVDGNHAGAFGYEYGSGRVVVSITQLSYPAVYTPSQYLYAGAKTYFINSLAWGLSTGVREHQSCASEGYTGTKLQWCKNICESELSAAQVDTWIHRWINRYRDLPYCAMEDEGEPELPPQEG